MKRVQTHVRCNDTVNEVRYSALHRYKEGHRATGEPKRTAESAQPHKRGSSLSSLFASPNPHEVEDGEISFLEEGRRRRTMSNIIEFVVSSVTKTKSNPRPRFWWDIVKFIEMVGD